MGEQKKNGFFTMGPIPGDKIPGWEMKELVVGDDGQMRHLILTSKFGELEFGRRPEGYDGWVFRENGGGGAITIPWVTIGGKIYVGLIRESRKNMGPNPQLCAIGEFVDPGESHTEAGAREANEEAGISLLLGEDNGVPFNANRGFFVANPEEGEGVHTFFVRYNERGMIGEKGSFLKFSQEFLATFDEKTRKKMMNVVFLHWQQAVRRCPDGIALAGISRLLAAVLPNE